MMRKMLNVLPPPGYIALFAILYTTTFLSEHFESDKLGSYYFRTVILLAASGLYGAYRVIVFHPTFSKRYLLFLALTPWSIEKPLPKGPVYIIWVDILVIGVLTLLCKLNGIIPPIWPTVTFLACYLFFLFFTFNKEHSLQITTGFLFTPFVVFPHRSPYFAAILLLLFYAIFYFGLKSYLKNFPWNTDFWKYDQANALLKQAVSQRVIGWPLRQLKCFDPNFEFTLVSSVAASLIITWWAHVLFWFLDDPALYGFIGIFFYAILLIRLAIYLRNGYVSPINIWGRIFTFRWIIPGYDKIFLAPICISLVFIGTILNSFMLSLNHVWIFDISLFLMLLVAFTMPPSLKEWRLTGKHRIFQNKRFQQRSQSSGKLISDNLMDKFRGNS